MSIPRFGLFDVVFGFDMETDLGPLSLSYEGLKQGTPRVLASLKTHNIRATFFWGGYAAEANTEVVLKVRNAGHEIGCRGLGHDIVGDILYPHPSHSAVLDSEVQGRIEEATRMVKKHSGIRPVSFRAPRLFGGTQMIRVLDKLGYVADASYPLHYHRVMLAPYHPSAKDWTKKGNLKIIEIPNLCDLAMTSRDPVAQRDRDAWGVLRTHSARVLLAKVDEFVNTVHEKKKRPVVCFRFNPWEFHPMPQGVIEFGDAIVRPSQQTVKNCGGYALAELDKLCAGLTSCGARFLTAAELADEY